MTLSDQVSTPEGKGKILEIHGIDIVVEINGKRRWFTRDQVKVLATTGDSGDEQK